MEMEQYHMIMFGRYGGQEDGGCYGCMVVS